MQMTIQTVGIKLDEAETEMVQRKFRFALTRFSPRLARVTVKLTDVNGPRNGDNKVCAVTMKLTSGVEVRATGQGTHVAEAAAAAANRAARTVHRAVERLVHPKRDRTLPQ